MALLQQRNPLLVKAPHSQTLTTWCGLFVSCSNLLRAAGAVLTSACIYAQPSCMVSSAMQDLMLSGLALAFMHIAPILAHMSVVLIACKPTAGSMIVVCTIQLAHAIQNSTWNQTTVPQNLSSVCEA